MPMIACASLGSAAIPAAAATVAAPANSHRRSLLFELMVAPLLPLLALFQLLLLQRLEPGRLLERDLLRARGRREGEARRRQVGVRLPAVQIDGELRLTAHVLAGDHVTERHRLRAVLDPDL